MPGWLLQLQGARDWRRQSRRFTWSLHRSVTTSKLTYHIYCCWVAVWQHPAHSRWSKTL